MNKLHQSLLGSLLALFSMSSDSYAQTSYRVVFGKVQVWADSPPSVMITLAKDGESNQALIPKDLYEIVRGAYNSSIPSSSVLGFRFKVDAAEILNKYQISIEGINEVGASGGVIYPEVVSLFKSCWESIPTDEVTEAKNLWFFLDAPLSPIHDEVRPTLNQDMAKTVNYMLGELKKDGCSSVKNENYKLSDDNYAYISSLFTKKYPSVQNEVTLVKGLRPLFWGDESNEGRTGGIWVEASRRHIKPILATMLQKMNLSEADLALLYAHKPSFLEWSRGTQKLESVSDVWLKSIGTSCLKNVEEVFTPFNLGTCDSGGKLEKYQISMGSTSKAFTIIGKK